MKKLIITLSLFFIVGNFSTSQAQTSETLGNLVIDSTLTVKDSLFVKGRTVIEKRLILKDGMRVWENARFEDGIRVVGVSRFDNNAIFKGNVRLDSIGNIPNAILNAGTMEFLVVLPNGQMKRGNMETLKQSIYFPSPIDSPCEGLFPDGINYNPVWLNGPNKIYSDFHAYIEESDACFGSTSREIENTQNTEKSKTRNELDLTEKDNEKIRVENDEIKVYLYPNPNEGDFSILIDNTNFEGMIYIYDLIGKEVFKEIINQKETRFSPQLTPGVYIVKWENGATSKTFKMIIQ